MKQIVVCQADIFVNTHLATSSWYDKHQYYNWFYNWY